MAIRAYYKQIDTTELEMLLKNPDSWYEDWGGLSLADLDLDKAWDDIHLLITGSWNRDGSNLSKAIFGNSKLGEEEGEFDEATERYFGTTYLTVSEVKEVAQALNRVSEEELRKKIEGDKYWVVYGDPEEQLLPYFRNILAFYNNAAQHENCVLVDIG